MTRTIRAALLASVALGAAPALALDDPRPCSAQGDPRVRCATYHPDAVIRLVAEVGATLIIEVPDGERVVAVPTSDNSAIAGGSPSLRLALEGADPGTAGATADRSLAVAVRSPTVTIQPRAPLVPQPFFVVTERDGKQVRYRFELSTGERGAGYYSVRMRNVAAEQAEARARYAATQAERNTRAAADRLRQAETAPCAAPGVNVRYMGQGDAAIAPAQVCDDGRSTWLLFPGSSRIPAIFTTLPDGREAAISVTATGQGWIMVHGTAPQMRLVDGGRALCLLNQAYSATGTNTGTGTVSPDVVRVARPTT